MKNLRLMSLPKAEALRLIQGLPFFNHLLQRDRRQLEKLLPYLRLFWAKPGEAILHKGDLDSWVYFVLRGQLLVYADQVSDQAPILSYLSPGEMFGAMAMLRDCERTATIIADPNCQEVWLFGMDFSPFGELDDCDLVNLDTKLYFYSLTIRLIQKRLENFRIDYPQHPLVQAIAELPALPATQGLPQLKAVYQHAQEVSALLCRCNLSLDQIGSLQLSMADLDLALLRSLAI